MPRPRKTSDFDVATAAAELLASRGAAAVTFAQVAQRSGLAPPTLVQRFGSREGLLAAIGASLPERVPPLFQPISPAESPLDRLHRALAEATPLQAAALYLLPNVTSSSFGDALRRQISLTLAAAIQAGELPRLDIARSARTLQIVFAGAVSQALLEGTPAAFAIREAVDAYLADYV